VTHIINAIKKSDNITVSSFVILGYEIFTILFSVLGFNKKKEIEKKEDKIVITDEVLEEENKGE